MWTCSTTCASNRGFRRLDKPKELAALPDERHSPTCGSSLRPSSEFRSQPDNAIPISDIHIDSLVFGRKQSSVMRNEMTRLFKFIHSLL
jgi:hypothetical protein